MKKRCSKCKEIKEGSEFDKNKGMKYGLRYECKVCGKVRAEEYHKTKRGIITKIYGQQKSNSKKRGHRMPEYTKKELGEWLMSQTLFHELFDEWMQSGYKSRLKPSVDRKNNYIHYCIMNIRLCTWGENHSMGGVAMVDGDDTRTCKVVRQYTKDGIFVAEYFSGREAERRTGIDQGAISYACIGKYKSAGGFVWNHR